MRTSVVDKYLNLVRNDARYFANYLKWMGTEVNVLKARPESLENYELAYGATASTFERNPENYSYSKAWISLDSLDFGKKENVHDLDILVYLPNNELMTGDLIQFEKLGRLFTYQVEPLDNYQNFVYRTILKLLDVEDLDGQHPGLRTS